MPPKRPKVLYHGDNPHRRLGAHIRDLRMRAGLTAEDVADAMRQAGHRLWTGQTLRDLMRTGSRNPNVLSALEAKDLAPILGVSLDELLDVPDVPAPEVGSLRRGVVS